MPNSQDLGKQVTLSYAVGQAAGASASVTKILWANECYVGDVNAATLTFDNFTVSDQAFLLVTNTSAFSTDISAQGYDGLVGKSFPPSSVCTES